jgi:hypothetical protein
VPLDVDLQDAEHDAEDDEEDDEADQDPRQGVHRNPHGWMVDPTGSEWKQARRRWISGSGGRKARRAVASCAGPAGARGFYRLAPRRGRSVVRPERFARTPSACVDHTYVSRGSWRCTETTTGLPIQPQRSRQLARPGLHLPLCERNEARSGKGTAVPVVTRHREFTHGQTEEKEPPAFTSLYIVPEFFSLLHGKKGLSDP